MHHAIYCKKLRRGIRIYENSSAINNTDTVLKSNKCIIHCAKE